MVGRVGPTGFPPCFYRSDIELRLHFVFIDHTPPFDNCCANVNYRKQQSKPKRSFVPSNLLQTWQSQ